MRYIKAGKIEDVVEALCIKANCNLSEDVENSLKQSLNKEESDIGKYILQQIIENVELARNEETPMCQDTGVAVVYVEIGQEVHIEGDGLYESINAGVSRGYTKGYLRKSLVDDPLFDRKNTGDNTPAVIYTEIVPGDQLKITIVPKGGGSENMGALKMLKPAEGLQGAKEFILDTVKKAGGNPCPPVIVGVGIGGTMEKAALLAKLALTREVGLPHADSRYARLEKELLEDINSLGIGPQGLGGRVTALAVHVETYPTHIATLPVAVAFNCHAARHAVAVI